MQWKLWILWKCYSGRALKLRCTIFFATFFPSNSEQNVLYLVEVACFWRHECIHLESCMFLTNHDITRQIFGIHKQTDWRRCQKSAEFGKSWKAWIQFFQNLSIYAYLLIFRDMQRLVMIEGVDFLSFFTIVMLFARVFPKSCIASWHSNVWRHLLSLNEERNPIACIFLLVLVGHHYMHAFSCARFHKALCKRTSLPLKLVEWTDIHLTTESSLSFLELSQSSMSILLDSSISVQIQ